MTVASKKKLKKELRRQLVHWWDGLGESWRLSLAKPGLKSMHTEQCEYEIKRLTKLVGPTPWRKVSLATLAHGHYQVLNIEMGIATEETIVDEKYVKDWADRNGVFYYDGA